MADPVPAGAHHDLSLMAADEDPPRLGLMEQPNAMKEDLLRMTDFFDTTLPGTLREHNIVVSFAPRVEDLRKKEYFRLPVVVRYGLVRRWEIYTGIMPYAPNPINSGADHRWGLGEGKLGVRYDWGRWGRVFDAVTLGLEGRTSLGLPPLSLTDYHAHLVPSIDTSRPLPWKFTTLVFNLSYDRAFDAPWREAAPPPPTVIRRSVFTVTPSVLYKPGEFGAFVEYNWRHIEDDYLGVHLGHEIKIGPLWDVPLWRTQSWGLPGKWQIELGGRVTMEEGLDSHYGVLMRVRWRTSLREVFTKESYERKPHP